MKGLFTTILINKMQEKTLIVVKKRDMHTYRLLCKLQFQLASRKSTPYIGRIQLCDIFGTCSCIVHETAEELLLIFPWIMCQHLNAIRQLHFYRSIMPFVCSRHKRGEGCIYTDGVVPCTRRHPKTIYILDAPQYILRFLQQDGLERVATVFPELQRICQFVCM